MKKIGVIVAALLLVSSASAGNIETCVESVQGSITVLKVIQTDLFHLEKYRELIQQFIVLKNYVVAGKMACNAINQSDLIEWASNKFGANLVKCCVDVYQLIKHANLLKMDIQEKNYPAAVQALADLVIITIQSKTDCENATFVVKK